MSIKRPDKRTRAKIRHAESFARSELNKRRRARIASEDMLVKGHCRSAWDNFHPRGKGPRPNAAKDNRSASDVTVYS